VFVRSESEVPAPVHLQDVLDDGLDALLDEYDALDRGFKRRERLDVKKPGPYFSTNNYAFRRSETPQEQESKQVSVVRSMGTAIAVSRPELHIKTQPVPRSKHTPSQLYKPVS
jgi:hypothetical protein